MGEKISRKQRAVLDDIHKSILEKGYGPTVREICQDLGLSSPSTVHAHLKTLEEKGYIKRDPLKSRSISLTEMYFETLEEEKPPEEPVPVTSIDVPVIGTIAAGVPILAEENITDVFTLPIEVVSDSASFILVVQGDSMVNAGIKEGDYLVVREQPAVNDGEIAVALLDDGATVKRFYQEKDYVRLQPENPSMSPIFSKECDIIGKVIAVLRRI